MKRTASHSEQIIPLSPPIQVWIVSATQGGYEARGPFPAIALLVQTEEHSVEYDSEEMSRDSARREIDVEVSDVQEQAFLLLGHSYNPSGDWWVKGWDVFMSEEAAIGDAKSRKRSTDN